MIFDFVTIASFLVIVPTVTGLIFYNRLPIQGELITLLLVSWFCAEIFAYVLRTCEIPNWYIYKLLGIAELFFVTRFYRSLFINERVKRNSILFACAGLMLVIFEMVYADGEGLGISEFYECLFFIGMGLYAFYEVVTGNKTTRYMGLNFCIMFMFLGSAVYFSSWHFMKDDKVLFKMFGDAHAILLLICYAYFTTNLWHLRS